ncbi:hypothetical protein [Embleya sp. AB8]|uniref:hypothetical protein n=1 Tax=Embleya sp. AB8 TaxID=3156304 RepID=UPI003C7360BC
MHPGGTGGLLLEVGDLVDGPDCAPPRRAEAGQLVRRRKAIEPAARCRTEIL